MSFLDTILAALPDLSRTGAVSPETVAMAQPPQAQPSFFDALGNSAGMMRDAILPQPSPPPPAPALPEPEGLVTQQVNAAMDPKLSAAIQGVESGGNPNAVSPKGAVGTHQVMPDAIRDVLMDKFGFTLDDVKAIPDDRLRAFASEPGISKYIGENYFNLNARRHPEWSTEQNLAAYNGGPTRLAEHGGDISQMPSETQAYVPKVMAGLEPENLALTPEFESTREGYQGVKAAMTEQALAHEKEMSDELATRTQFVRESRDEQEAMVARQAAMEKAAEDALKKREEARQAFLSGSVDPNRVFSKMGTADKILSAIAVALGGFGAGLTGGKNSAMDIITHAIDNDMDAQRIELEKKGKYAEFTDDAYKDIVKLYEDKEQAAAAMRSLKLERAKMMIESVGAQAKGADAKTNALKLASEADIQLQKSLQDLQEKAAKDPARNMPLISMYEKGKISLEELPPDLRERTIPGIGVASSSPARGEVLKKKDQLDPIMNNINFLLNTRSGNRMNISDRDLAARVKSVAEELKLNYKNFYELGALQPREVEMVNTAISDPTSWRVGAGMMGQDPVVAVLKDLRDRTKKNFQGAVANRITHFFPDFAQQQEPLSIRPR